MAVETQDIPRLEDRDARKGVLLMLGGLALFSILNGVVKAQAATFPVNQIVFFRNSFGLFSLVLLMQMMGGRALLVTRRPGAQFWQAFCFTGVLVFMFFAYQHMPLADATAISFLQPLLVVLLSAPLLGEKVSPSRWIAVGVGFAGVLLMVQPSGQGSLIGALAAGIATLFSAICLIQQRFLSRDEQTLTIVFYTMLFSSLIVLPSLFWAWVQPTPWQFAGLVAMGLASGFCQYVTTRAVFFAPVASIAPIKYTAMLWAIVIGYLWFGDIPTIWVLIGSSIVILATLIILRTPGKRPETAVDP
jgi:drug/metabolite transporter (DMT)-like permease